MLPVGSPIRPCLRVHARPVLIARAHVARRTVRGMRRAVSVGRARGRDGRICGGVSLACSYRASAAPSLSGFKLKRTICLRHAPAGPATARWMGLIRTLNVFGE